MYYSRNAISSIKGCSSFPGASIDSHQGGWELWKQVAPEMKCSTSADVLVGHLCYTNDAYPFLYPAAEVAALPFISD